MSYLFLNILIYLGRPLLNWKLIFTNWKRIIRTSSWLWHWIPDVWILERGWAAMIPRYPVDMIRIKNWPEFSVKTHGKNILCFITVWESGWYLPPDWSICGVSTSFFCWKYCIIFISFVAVILKTQNMQNTRRKWVCVWTFTGFNGFNPILVNLWCLVLMYIV